MIRHCLALSVLACLPATGRAQSLDVPFMPYQGCLISFVQGLDPNGDNFLAVRSGPGSRYPMIDRLHEKDYVCIDIERNGWVGIRYGGKDRIHGQDHDRRGWVHGRFIAAG